MPDLENASQILSYHGDPGLAYGTAGSDATAAPIGVLDIKHDAFDQVATLKFLKDKGLYDAKKKELDDTYAKLREVNLATDKLLDIDKQKIISDFINPIKDFLTKNPNAVNPHTPEQVKQSLQFQTMYNDYLDAKAKGQTRYIYKPIIDQSIADNTFDREDEKKWYETPLNTALAPITPYGKHYLLDVAPLKGGEEETVVGKEGPVLHTETKSKDNFYTTFTSTLNKLTDTADKGFQKALDGEVETYLDTYNLGLQKRNAAISQANNIVNPVEKEAALKAANNIQPFLFQEINNYNNRATVNNKIRPDKAVPLIDITKPLTREQYLLVKSINKNVNQPLQSYDERTSGRYGIDTRANTAALKRSGLSDNTFGILSQVVHPFQSQNDEAAIYQKGINGDKKFETYNQADTSNPDVNYNGNDYSGVEVVKGPNGMRLARIKKGEESVLIKYNPTTKVWDKVEETPRPIDDKILKTLHGTVSSITDTNDGKIVVNYKTTKGENKSVSYDPVTYFKNIASSTKQFDETMREMRDYGINLNTKEGLDKAIELVTKGTIDGKEPTKAYIGNDGLTDKDRGVKANIQIQSLDASKWLKKK